ncbi:ABC transporter permease [Glycomyces terrestris]|uniref:ABC transporter permease n=1 Tax=Glycomyces terrestris TaxID=2493553 RepID=A0A426V2V5_9ACTN|nr:ABC transporter permease [Glycomyces terrestris]RRS01239.1 ABC transporter permease [Glycomyces terrestris]
MGGAAIAIDWRFAAVLTVLLGAAALAAKLSGLRSSKGLVTAGLRAAVQLAAVSLLITWVLTAWGPTAAFIVLMVAVAAFTSARRLGTRRLHWAAAAICAGTAPVLALILAAGTVPFEPVAVVPVAGILIGGAMNATSLAGRGALDALRDRHGEYEALLALGITEQHAVRELCRPVAAQALHPALDQTRTVGLVTLPGAFIGVLLGGGDPVQAGATQLLVLIGLLAAETLAVATITEAVARRRVLPA